MKKGIVGAVCVVFVIIAVIAGIYFIGNEPGTSASPQSFVFQGSLAGGRNVIPAGNDYIAISSGSGHQLALRANGSIICWGDNKSGQCEVPQENDFTAIAAGYDYSLALRSNGTIACWGARSHCNILPQENNFIAISAGNENDLALRSNGTIVCWGRNRSGECNVPREDDFVAIDAAQFQGFSLRNNGTIACWGGNNEVCDNPPENNIVSISANRWTDHIALTSDGKLLAWDSVRGWNYYVPPGDDYVTISTGEEKKLALRSDGSVVCWGGKLARSCDIISIPNVIAISADDDNSLAITNPRAKEILAAEWQKNKARITVKSGTVNQQQSARLPVYPAAYVINASLSTAPNSMMTYTINHPENLTHHGNNPSGIITITSVNYHISPLDVTKDNYHFISYHEVKIKNSSTAIEEFKTHRLSVDETYLWQNGPVDKADRIVVTDISLVYIVRPTVMDTYVLQPVYRFQGYIEKGSARSSFNSDNVPATENLVEYDFLKRERAL